MSGIDKVRYMDHDRRMNLYDTQGLDDVKLRSASVASIIPRHLLKKTSDGCYQLQGTTLGVSYRLDPQAAFCDEITGAIGTTFLVGPNLVLTAAHCVCEQNSNQVDEKRIKRVRIVFGFQMLGLGKCQSTFKKDAVYSIQKIVAHRMQWGQNRSIDWALLKLNRPVVGCSPLKLNFQQEISVGMGVNMLGYPSGLPLKFTHSAHVKASHTDYFEADLDAFGGNSGSPVFKGDQVEGILVRGLSDYDIVIKDDGSLGMSPHQATPAEIQLRGYEKCFRVSVIDTTFQWYIQASCQDVNYQYQLGCHYLQSNHIKKGVSWIQKAAFSGHGVAKQKLSELYAPLRTPSPSVQTSYWAPQKGLNFEAICITNTCSENGKTVLIKKGLGNFDIARESFNLQCPSCNQDISVEKIQRLIFQDCTLMLDGRANPNQSFQHQEKAKNQLKAFTLHGNKFFYLNVQTT